jgi:hypothetical protein
LLLSEMRYMKRSYKEPCHSCHVFLTVVDY